MIWKKFPSVLLRIIDQHPTEQSGISYSCPKHNPYDGDENVPKPGQGNDNLVPDGIFGSRTIGFRYENEHRVKENNGRFCSILSSQHGALLELIHQSLTLAFPGTKKLEKILMRTQFQAGAKTEEHTDTMRGNTSSYLLIQPNSGFILRVRLFPLFRCSVVKYNGILYIPHSLSPHQLVLIGEKDNQAHFFVFSPMVIDKLQAHGNILKFIVVGIKSGKLQCLAAERLLEVIATPAILPCVSIQDAFKEAQEHPSKIPRKKFMDLSKENMWLKFNGWMHAHRWQQYSNPICRRIYIFYRYIREETSSARLHNDKKTGSPRNYTIIDE